MNSLHLDLPESQLVLNAQDKFQKQIIAANYAIISAINGTMDFDAPIAANLFGLSNEHLALITGATKSALATALTIGLPIFSLRIATMGFMNVLNEPQGTDTAMTMLLDTFDQAPPLLSLGEPFSVQRPPNSSEAMLEVQDGARRLIELANYSVLDAVRSLQTFDDPLASHLFGAEQDVLLALSQLPRARTLQLVLTGVPIFAVRQDWPQALLFAENDGISAPVSMLLNSFGLASLSAMSA